MTGNTGNRGTGGATIEGLRNLEIQEKYRSAAPRYDVAMRPLDYVVLRRWRRFLIGRAAGRVLEVACGTGVNLQYYPDRTSPVLVDLSPDMLSIARKRATDLSMMVESFVMDAARLEFPTASFDTVVSSLGTCSFPDPVASLTEMSRVCRPGGQILLLEHGRSTAPLLAAIQDRYAAPWASRTGCRWNHDVLGLISRAGMKPVMVKTSLWGIVCCVVATPGSYVHAGDPKAGNTGLGQTGTS